MQPRRFESLQKLRARICIQKKRLYAPPISNQLLTVPRRYSCCGSSGLHFMTVCIWSLAVRSAGYRLPIILHVLFCFVVLNKKIGKNRYCCRFQLGKLKDHLFGKELFIR